MRGKANFKGVLEQGEYKLVPPGQHLGIITAVKDKTTKNGDPMVGVQITIAGGEFQDCWVWDNIIIADNPNSPGYKILGRSKHFLHCIGASYEGEVVEWDSEEWMGKEVLFVVDHEPPNEYHKGPKAVVSQYLLPEEKLTNDDDRVPF